MTTSTSVLPGGGTTALVLPPQLSAENKSKLAALGKAWLLAKMELAKPAPAADLKWIQTVADSNTFALDSLVAAYTNAPDTKRETEVAALRAFAKGALTLIKAIAIEAPAEAQGMISGWLKQLEFFKEDASTKADNLQQGVEELSQVLAEIHPPGSGTGTEYGSPATAH